MRHRLVPARGHSIVGLISVLALLALACFPISAQAVIPQYTEGPETSTGKIPTREDPPANISQTPKNGTTSDSGSNSSNKKASSEEDETSQAGGGSNKGDGGKGQGSPPNGSTSHKASPGTSVDSSAGADGDDGSSPLVPILIALAVLAAISIGVVVARQRRQGGGSGESDARVSPEAS